MAALVRNTQRSVAVSVPALRTALTVMKQAAGYAEW